MDVLLAMLGHDLRNPGTTLVSCLELLDEVVTDPEGREALEDADIALAQLRTAWARIDALANRRETRWGEVADVMPELRKVARRVSATLDGPPTLDAPSGVSIIIEALAETTRRGRISVTKERIVVTDEVGCLPADQRALAFDVDAQPEMKRLGRYARFAGLVAAKRVADRLGLTVRAGSEALFELVLG